ncbi:hypothetical protein KC367_g8885 [Hortaea werneckii]|nr:hypothetical protein KC315_g2632 [Hortaea werneckii]KAI7492994.1 hypothetical protein KC367_g8885 [Hortaea werneckii]
MLLPRFRTVRLVIVLLLIVAAFIAPSIYRRRNTVHVLHPNLHKEQTLGPSEHLLLPDKIPGFCATHGFTPFKETTGGRKVYDLFLLSSELDWLEIRLHTLSPYVDFFVIVESRTTFTGLKKPAYLEENWDKFKPFHRKIIHRVVEDPGSEVVGGRTWDHEDFFRNALFDKVFADLVGTPKQANEGDVLVVSDIDEVPKPETLFVLRKCEFPDRLTLRSHFYYYSFQWSHKGEQWAHPQATSYRGLQNTILPKDLRNGEAGTHGWFFINHLRAWWDKADLWDAAWHCSSCFATIKAMQTKMESFSHTPWNTPKNRDPDTIVERVRNGKDLFGRPDEVYERVDRVEEGLMDVPYYIVQNESRFGYLLDRDGEGAGFTDYQQSKS